jgi:hypothetical protein
MPDYEEVRIFHPGTKGESVQPRSSLATWYRSGWMLVDESQQPAAEAEPEPISAAEVEAAKQQADQGQAEADTKAAKSTSKSAKE